ncbi:HK97 family phage prohead protease [Palleronia sp. KMU-117]|uniref:HK97 family phage prohead protease n=1 Tax=Palleronia sp. KMU-117 TaxID=3434108 RepID=UPI003D73A6DD
MKPNIKQKAAELQGKRIDIEVASKAVSIDDEKHTATFVMSTATIDRHGDIVDQDSWILEHFMSNPAFFWGHRSNDFPLGKWLRVWLEPDPEMDGEKMLMGEAEFAVEVHPDIERAWNHVKRGDLNMVSVGFIPHIVDYDEKRDAFVLKSCELMECSLVGIGANRRALVKGDDAIKQTLIDVKEQITETIDEEDPAITRKKNAITLLNKAIRQFQK